MESIDPVRASGRLPVEAEDPADVLRTQRWMPPGEEDRLDLLGRARQLSDRLIRIPVELLVGEADAADEHLVGTHLARGLVACGGARRHRIVLVGEVAGDSQSAN